MTARRQEVGAAAAPVLTMLRTAERNGRARRPQLIWVAGLVTADLDPALAPALAAAAGVAAVRPGSVAPPAPPGAAVVPGGAPAPAAAPTTVAPSLLAMNVNQVWDNGFTGQGITVAVIDSGIDFAQPDLAARAWTNAAEIPGNGLDDDGNGFVDDVSGWDFLDGDNTPQDDTGHGTMLAGLVAGDGAGGTRTGAAPGARVMALRAGPTEASVWRAIQYAIDNGADIVVQGITFGWTSGAPPDYGAWRTVTDTELAAGMLHVAVLGERAADGRAVPYEIHAPANAPPPSPHATQTAPAGKSSVLGAANVVLDTRMVATTSARGPAEWTDIRNEVDPAYPYEMPPGYRDYPYRGGAEQGLLKPDLAAIGDGAVAPVPGGGYAPFGGTAAAAGHLAGVAALLLSLHPGVTPAAVADALFRGAVDAGDPGWDPLYGEGLVDALAAAETIGLPCSGHGGDQDRDGVCTDVDNCPLYPNPDQADADHDGVGDACDCAPGNPDVHAIPAEVGPTLTFRTDRATLTWTAEPDAQTYDLYKGKITHGVPFAYAHTCHQLDLPAPEGTDTFLPALGDAFYYLVSSRNCFGAGPLGGASDGTPRPGPDTCPDTDADGVRDLVDDCPATPDAGQADVDRDGAGDVCDDCPAVYDPAQKDSDADGLGDVCDPCPLDPLNDTDQDGICGSTDNCPSTPNPDQLDRDGDGLGDACDACPLDPQNDIDGDAVCGDVDNCPATPNPDQLDRDGDGRGDVCDACPLDPQNDIDGDGVCGNVDNCPATPNPDQVDSDADGLGDPCDPCPFDVLNDVDGDGVCGSTDNCPATPNPDQADRDTDGVGDACDCAPDNVAVHAPATVVGASLRLAADTRTLTWDPQADAETYNVYKGTIGGPFAYDHTCHATGLTAPQSADGAEPALGRAFYYLVAAQNCFGEGPLGAASDGPSRPGPDACPDADGDGVRDRVDNCPSAPNAGQQDDDRDGLGNACDPCPGDRLNDADQDGICGMVDNCPTVANPGQEDSDADGLGDACDACPHDALNDIDRDQVCGDADNCPVTFNPDQLDSDLDGLGDVCDACPHDALNDVDHDSVCGNVDNCPATPNPDQADADHDGAGDACDCAPADASVHGVPEELGPSVRFDADHVTLRWDAQPGAQTFDVVKGYQGPGAWTGYDHTCLANGVTTNSVADPAHPAAGKVAYYLVRPANCFGPGPLGSSSSGAPIPGATGCVDSDLDGVADPIDNCPAAVNADQQDVDFDGLGDACDACPHDPRNDLDKDGICGDVDNCPSTPNPNQADADQDGVGDLCDVCPTDPKNDVDGDGVCGSVDNCPSVPNPAQEDTDHDGLGDVCDACPLDAQNDADKDGVCGNVDNCPTVYNPNQADSNGDGTGDACTVTSGPQVSGVKGIQALGAWLVGSPYGGTGTLSQTRWRISTADGADFDAQVVYDTTLALAPLTEVRALYDHPITAGMLYARVAYKDEAGWSAESASTAFPAQPLPLDDGAAGARDGTVEISDSFEGPDIVSTSRPDALDRGGRLWPAALAEPSTNTAEYFTLRGNAATAPNLGTFERAQTALATGAADSFAVVSLTPSAVAPNYDFSFGLRASGAGLAHRSYRCKVERLTSGDTIKFNKYYDGSRSGPIANWSGNLGPTPWRVRFEAITEGSAVRLRAFTWNGTGWVLKTEFVDSGASGNASWDTVPRILDPGHLVISHEKQGDGRYEDVRAGRLN